METFIDIIALASLAHLIVEYNQDQQLFDHKPFTCNLCMGFWVALFPAFIDYGLWGLPFAALVGVTSETIYKLLQRL